MTRFLGAFALLITIVTAGPLQAQDTSWVQIEARPTEAEALERASDYAARLPDVNGFRLNTGWYAITLGPYSEAVARARLAQLRTTGAIPNDSYVTDGVSYLGRIFGLNIALAIPRDPPLPGADTLAEARAAESALTREDRQEVQIALRDAGFYNSVIDADFGPGTRRAMGAWQAANGFAATGVLTERQLGDLIEGYRDVVEALGLETVRDEEIGIEVTLPLGLVAFDRYEPPFAHYHGADGEPRVLLISQAGNRASLTALYDVLETLEIMPLDGPRQLSSSSFTLTGADDALSSHAYAELTRAGIKGYVLIWPSGDDNKRRRALAAMEESFLPLDGVLPDDAGATQDIDLLAGLRIRKPERAVSGFFVTPDGSILTSASAVDSCGRLEIGEETVVTVSARDAGTDLALLKPTTELSPLAYARLTESEPRLQSDIAVAGFSFGGVLSLPSVTFGTLADVRGLDGDEGVHRLALVTEPGDTGGPVFDATGAVTGMLLPEDTGTRVLPADVAFARDAAGLTAFLSANGVQPAVASRGDAIAPEDLTTLAADMTVLVTCWN